ncbi:MAG: hypothetical protein IPP07_01410 [Holophagales bacterium]|jgi:hypothetical protein|nr:hypothetical protein [Holophagales bacterium]MBK9963615.1 hypothetical protein [Holophagales bacterium]
MKNLVNLVKILGFGALAATALLSGVAEAQAGPYQYYAVSPCRVYDTRTGLPSAGGTGGGILNTATVRTFVLRNLCGIPTDATAVSLNLTVVTPTAPQGDLRIAPYPGTFPNVSTSNYVTGETIANGAIVPMGTVVTPGTDPDFQVVAAGCFPCSNTYTFHLLVDVNGYFR